MFKFEDVINLKICNSCGNKSDRELLIGVPNPFDNTEFANGAVRIGICQKCFKQLTNIEFNNYYGNVLFTHNVYGSVVISESGIPRYIYVQNLDTVEKLIQSRNISAKGINGCGIFCYDRETDTWSDYCFPLDRPAIEHFMEKMK